MIVNISASLIDEHLCDNFSIYFNIEYILNQKYKALIYASSIIGGISIVFFIFFLLCLNKISKEDYGRVERILYLYSFGKIKKN